jgi:hypothetical protein
MWYRKLRGYEVIAIIAGVVSIYVIQQFIPQLKTKEASSILTLIFAILIVMMLHSSKAKREENKKYPNYPLYSQSPLRFRIINSIRINVIVFGILLISFLYFRESFPYYILFTLLMTYIALIFYGVIINWLFRKEPYSLFYTIKNFSFEAWQFLIIGILVIFLVYTYAQCHAFNMPLSFQCVIQTIGR